MEGSLQRAAAEGAPIRRLQVIQQVGQVRTAGYRGHAQVGGQLRQGQVIQEGAFFAHHGTPQRVLVGGPRHGPQAGGGHHHGVHPVGPTTLGVPVGMGRVLQILAAQQARHGDGFAEAEIRRRDHPQVAAHGPVELSRHAAECRRETRAGEEQHPPAREAFGPWAFHEAAAVFQKAAH